jgi:SagB-type dehydrogenase family enzyme
LHRQFLRNDNWDMWDTIDRDQMEGVPPPPLQQPVPAGAPQFDLVAPTDLTVGSMPLIEAIGRRRSERDFTPGALTLEELSFLLWATQGFKKAASDGSWSLRSVPSAGGRHPFETYLLVKRVDGLPPGLYRYLPLEHRLCLLSTLGQLAARIPDISWLEPDEALLFLWTVVPYRTEWRYGILSHKMIAMEAGHICQNLYLAAVSVGAGACAVGAFPQAEINDLLAVDGEEEFAVYLARVGRIPAE